MLQTDEFAEVGKSSRGSLSAIVMLYFLALSGCSTVETNSFVVVKGSRVESAQIATGADFSKYDRLQAADMGIFFPSDIGMRDSDLQRLRETFRSAFTAALDGYSVSREPGPTTMLVEASLIDLRGSSETAAMSLRRDLQDLASAGSLVFLMEMKDSETGRTLARAADSAKAPVLGTNEKPDTDWQAVEEAAAYWASLFRQFLDESLTR